MTGPRLIRHGGPGGTQEWRQPEAAQEIESPDAAEETIPPMKRWVTIEVPDGYSVTIRLAPEPPFPDKVA